MAFASNPGSAMRALNSFLSSTSSDAGDHTTSRSACNQSSTSEPFPPLRFWNRQKAWFRIDSVIAFSFSWNVWDIVSGFLHLLMATCDIRHLLIPSSARQSRRVLMCGEISVLEGTTLSWSAVSYALADLAYVKSNGTS